MLKYFMTKVKHLTLFVDVETGNVYQRRFMNDQVVFSPLKETYLVNKAIIKYAEFLDHPVVEHDDDVFISIFNKVLSVLSLRESHCHQVRNLFNSA